jgi:hypothetical protein
MNKRTIPFLLAALTLVLAACTMQTVTDVKADGSGSFTIEYGFTQEELDSLAQFGMTADQTQGACNMSESMGTDMPSGITFQETKRGDVTWCTFTKDFKNLDEMKAYFSTEMSGMVVNRLEIADGKFYYDVNPGSTGDTSSLDMLGVAMDFNWVLKVPGKVGANNATKADGNTLTWNLLAKDLPSQFTAESTLGGGGLFGLELPNVSPVVILLVVAACCVLPVIVVIVIVVVILMRRKKTPAA